MVHLIGDIFAVLVDDDANNFELEIFPEDDWYKLTWDCKILDEDSGFYGEDVGYDAEIPAGNWAILFCTKIVQEADLIVMPELRATVPWLYFDFEKQRDNHFYSAKNSLYSLIKSKALHPNKNYVILKKIIQSDYLSIV